MPRLFVAVQLSDRARSHLAEGIAPLRSSLSDWRWVRFEQWHVTLAFLGDVPESNVEALDARLGRVAARYSPFALSLRGLGAFSSAGRARVVWCGIDGDRDVLKRLAASVGAAARKCGIAQQDRAYRPHLTLGRRRESANVREVLDPHREYAGPVFDVVEFVLMESHLGPQVRHDIRARYPLG